MSLLEAISKIVLTIAEMIGDVSKAIGELVGIIMLVRWWKQRRKSSSRVHSEPVALQKTQPVTASQTELPIAAQTPEIYTLYSYDRFVEEVFRSVGFDECLVQCNGEGLDVDGVLKREGKTYLLECKSFCNGRVTIGHLQRFHRLIKQMQADGGFFVTTSPYTAEAVQFARASGIQLI